MSQPTIRISEQLLEKAKQPIALGIIFSTVKVTSSSDAVKNALTLASQQLKQLPVELSEIPGLHALRTSYQELGLAKNAKARAKYIGSQQAFLERARKDTAPYFLNNVVDCNNFMSMWTMQSLGSYDLSKLNGDIEFRPGNEGEQIADKRGRALKLQNLPLLADAEGPFGNPTRDSDRALITDQSKTIMTVVYSFGGTEGLAEALQAMAGLLKAHCSASELSAQIIDDSNTCTAVPLKNIAYLINYNHQSKAFSYEAYDRDDICADFAASFSDDPADTSKPFRILRADSVATAEDYCHKLSTLFQEGKLSLAETKQVAIVTQRYIELQQAPEQSQHVSLSNL